MVWGFNCNVFYGGNKFKIGLHWRPEGCSRGAVTVGLVVALKYSCNKSAVSRCWGHGTQDTKKLRSLKKCRTALQAELCVTIQLLFWKEETHMHSCILLCEVSPTAWAYCIRCYRQLQSIVLRVKKRKEQQLTALHWNLIAQYSRQMLPNRVVKSHHICISRGFFQHPPKKLKLKITQNNSKFQK